ncbi:hypothetical protein ASZ90_015610 [hydrocarbon metagenome]|uniref:Uncharacterized protein n=1 Tax=hydrocarbon metagenome TaxID=938273 RepID=A0A0W8F1H4_9ZZZZ
MISLQEDQSRGDDTRGNSGSRQVYTIRRPIPSLSEHHMAIDWLLSWGIIFIIIAIILMILGFAGKLAWKIGKWLIIIFIILAVVSWVFGL